jgi:molybdenum cofactor synthesis domain-containing protein
MLYGELMTKPPPSHDQEQFLTILSRDDAFARFEAAVDPKPLRKEPLALAQALGRVLAGDVLSPIDVPPFDRSVVDGFAVRARDIVNASEGRPVRLTLNAEVIACGVAPAIGVQAHTATPIATGGPIPRGADAVVMVEHVQSEAGAILVRRPANPGQFVGFAGSDMARGETLLRAGIVIGSREVGMLAACGLATVEVYARPRVGVLSTGDELVAPGEPLRAAAIYDSNGPITCAAIAENGGEPVFYGAFPDEPEALRAAIAKAFNENDMVVLSGGTSKGAGDITYRIVGELGRPGIIAHGVALKPGKPLCLAVCGGKPVVVLPGFPTSAMFTFHDIVAPILRRLAGLPPRAEATVEAVTPLRIGSEVGRTEYAMVSLVATPDGYAAYPVGKGSGSVTAFAQADGFLTIEALSDHLPAGSTVSVRLLTPHVRSPDLVAIGSHCTGLDAVNGALAREGVSVRTLAVGSLGGLAALKRGECDLAPIHLLDPKTGTYNAPFLGPAMTLVPGWRRMQGVVFRRSDARFEGKSALEAVAGVIRDGDCLMVNRNQGAGTRILMEQLLAGAKPEGYWNQPRSHNAVAAAVARGAADWGLAIAPVAEAYDLGFLPLAEEHYDFAALTERLDRPAVKAFLAALARPGIRNRLAELGFSPAEEH